MDDDDWEEHAMRASFAGDAEPVVVVCFFDSTEELKGFIEERWLELQASFGDEGVPELACLPWIAENVGVRLQIDKGMELSLCFYPVIEGEHREDLGEGAGDALLQLHDDGRGGVDAGQLRLLVEWLLEDILPYVGSFNANLIEERFVAEGRSLVLTSTSGQLLELPPSMQHEGSGD